MTLAVLTIRFSLLGVPDPSLALLRQIRESHLVLADLRNYWYTIVFPKRRERIRYGGKSEYLYSLISPTGRSLFASRRQFDPTGRVFDTLIKREVTPTGPSPEEIIPTPFIVLFQFAVSSNERFIVVAGRLQDSTIGEDQRDGIFLWDRMGSSVRPLASYESRSQDIRSFNVDDAGDEIIYEDNATVMVLKGSNGHLVLTDHHAGKFPVLIPDRHAYMYSDLGKLILNDGEKSHELLDVSNLVGAIRVSPDARFVAFGLDPAGNLGLTQLRICELKTLACVNGPEYNDWIAARETYWIKQ